MVTPNDIASELGITGKALRTFLRAPANGFARSPAELHQRWEFTRQQADAVKHAYRARRAPTIARLKGPAS